MTFRKLIKVGIHGPFAVTILALSLPHAARASSPPGPAGALPSLGEEVARIENDPDQESRYQAMRRVVAELHQDSSRVVESDVAALTRLLRDPSDLVRDRAAVALGLIGPRASRAVPALRAALDEVECVRADQNSSFAIAIALRRIGVEPNAPECIATPYYGLKPRLRGRGEDPSPRPIGTRNGSKRSNGVLDAAWRLANGGRPGRFRG